ncbi:hypothetical protein NSA24_03065 [Clostridioides mangenotii]|uniref:hypothetical protein n=1 Tax=Metaclostridioides mangenotii TaxID=1540 RepID=UPI002149B767|nr:hypothetical protein [Clostridioides mangenotii]MCR1953815.1 hypothetical protein [Clostridioides mangenotii]
MAKYRKKPVVIDAEPYREGLEDGFEWEKESYAGEHRENVYLLGSDWEPKKIPYIETLEGNMYIEPTDMIITGVKGERYPCKKDIFDMTYEKVEG